LSASFDVTDNFSLCASVIAQKTSAELTSAVNYNAVGMKAIQSLQQAAAAGLITPAEATATAGQISALLPPGADGFARIKGDDWAYGWQLGGYWKLSPNDKLALNYRSKISHTLEGTGNFTTTAGYDRLLASPLGASLPPFQHTTGTADFTTPAVASASYWHQAERFGLGIDLAWTKWSAFQDLTVNYGNSQPSTSEHYNWRNTWYASVGGDYNVNDKLTVRAGVAVDSTPTYLATRSARVPDSTRKLATVGLSYQASDNFEINASYAHIFVNNAHVDTIDSTGNRLAGNFEDYGNLLGVSATYKF
jgi:long-chain fatty acid transport protein